MLIVIAKWQFIILTCSPWNTWAYMLTQLYSTDFRASYALKILPKADFAKDISCFIVSGYEFLIWQRVS